ncbi:unnamed protein product [Phyllotreta striolata]|uniref:Uncharacterized protein n=1 Tax=Phyllotreta striolata TaxID=444603 RepID=A0A9N9TVU2_PHYSR|nr:unnamed protein product [Phyllotreta striolata]
MALRHVVIFNTIVVLWCLQGDARATADAVDKKDAYLVQDKVRRLFFPAIDARKISQRAAFQNIDLLTARSFGKRAECYGGSCEKRVPQFGARLYGKRDFDFGRLRCILADCAGMENSGRYRRHSSGIFHADHPL